MAAQRAVEALFKKMGNEAQEPSLLQMASAAIVGLISTPPLAILNGQTMGYTTLGSLRALSWKQTSAITVRESSFLLAIRVSGPAAQAMRTHFGVSRPVEYGIAFMTGVVGALVGHAADTALSIWQKKRTILSPAQLAKGAPARALAVGGFSLCYKAASDWLNTPKRV